MSTIGVQPTVLIVDDSPDTTAVINSILKPTYRATWPRMESSRFASPPTGTGRT